MAPDVPTAMNSVQAYNSSPFASGKLGWKLVEICVRRGWDYEEMQQLGSQGRKLSPHAVQTRGSTR